MIDIEIYSIKTTYDSYENNDNFHEIINADQYLLIFSPRDGLWIYSLKKLKDISSTWKMTSASIHTLYANNKI